MIELTRDADVAMITLRRPERRNALDIEHCDALREAVEGATADGVRAMVVTGEGTSFCAGADLDGVYGEAFRESLYAALRATLDTPVPVIAAVNGPAIGAGTQLAIACDLRIASDTAVFGVPTARNGLAVDVWTMRRLVELAGGAAARRIMLSGELFDAGQARHYGLCDRAGDVVAAEEWATELASLAPLALAYNKLVLNSPDAGVEDDRLSAAFDACWASSDIEEARAARQEKRAPLFRGR
ncbi:enoyl-CoA hydratase [Solicola gregarius]|uniref:Enoyl-CoA hydratase n=1 Tax=Solicola gregarius TaxID=2908642 RepID=A0AA46TH68_9ACTN|nr:enoyl-CoA hydratase [Solicola gregarius]UYM04433.1 enoyl-CoA hydratase [Solicola gregarius]